MFVVHRGRAATAAAVVFSAQGLTAAAMMKPGRPDLSAGECSQEAFPYRFPWGVGRRRKNKPGPSFASGRGI